MPQLRVALGLFYVNLLWVTGTYSQRSLTSFGPLSDFAVDYTPLGLATGRFRPGGPPQIVVLSAESPAIHFYDAGNPASLVQTQTMALSNSPAVVATSDVDGDGTAEILTLSSDGMSVSIISQRGGTVDEKVFSLNTPAQRFIIADVNNDKRKDILLFGKKRTGMSTLLGKPGNTFAEGPLLFPEISISDARTTDLNGDGITDILLLNWLSNQVAVFYGIGRGIFSEQLTIDLDGEPLDLAITSVTKQRTILVAVTLPERRTISLFVGGGAGEFEPTRSIACGGPPAGVEFSHLNDDLFPDVVSSTDQGILVSLGVSAAEFDVPTLFGASNAISFWMIADVDADAKKDLVYADRSAKRIGFLGNATSASTWPNQYCVGAGPRGLTVGDFNDDGIADIAVVNGLSATLSVLVGTGKGLMGGQQSFALPDHPEFVTTLSSGVTPQRSLIVSHSSVDKVTVVHLADDVSGSTSFSISTGSTPFVLFGKEDPVTHLLEILVRYTRSKDKSLSLSLFEQIGSGQFLERSLRPNLPDRILALTVDALGPGSPYTLIFVTNDKVSRQSSLSLGFGEGVFDFKTTKTLLSYPDSTASTRSVISAEINGDAFKDIVLYLGQPRNALGIVYGRGDGTVRDSIVWVRGVHLIHEDALLFRDVDGDSETDITYLDAVTKSVMVAYAQRDGSFLSPVAVAAAPGVSAFRVEAMRNPNKRDLILSNEAKGTVSIIFNPFNR